MNPDNHFQILVKSRGGYKCIGNIDNDMSSYQVIKINIVNPRNSDLLRGRNRILLSRLIKLVDEYRVVDDNSRQDFSVVNDSLIDNDVTDYQTVRINIIIPRNGGKRCMELRARHRALFLNLVKLINEYYVINDKVNNLRGLTSVRHFNYKRRLFVKKSGYALEEMKGNNAFPPSKDGGIQRDKRRKELWLKNKISIF